MNDKLKFHRMTRPLRFRRTRLFFQSVEHTYKVGIEKSKYLFNYILYKLNILNRYTNSVITDMWRPVINGEIPEVFERELTTKHFVVTVRTTIVDHITVIEDYFYYVDKKGVKHKTYVVEEREQHDYVLKSSVIKPGIIIDGKQYVYGNVPIVVQRYKKPEILPFNGGYSTSRFFNNEEVIQYDLTPLINVAQETRIDCYNGVSVDTVRYLREYNEFEILKYLGTLTLRDLEVGTV